MAKRPAIPEPLRRAVLVEAGHRCAVCREPAYDLAHIEPWSKVKEHTFENLIAVCPNCHRRHHKGEIDSGALRIYKGNLSIVKSRYSDYERRVLEYFALRPSEVNGIVLVGADFQVMYLIRDGLLEDRGPYGARVSTGGMELGPKAYLLTPAGREFVDKWISGEDLEHG